MLISRFDCTSLKNKQHKAVAYAAVVLLQGEDICMALQTHINDIMMKRLTAHKSGATATAAGSTPTPAVDAAGRGPQYDSHISTMQTKLDATMNRSELFIPQGRNHQYYHHKSGPRNTASSLHAFQRSFSTHYVQLHAWYLFRRWAKI